MQVSRPQVHSASGHLCRACIRMMGTAGAKLVLRLFTFAAKSGMLWNAGGPGQRTQQPHTAPQLRAWRPAAPTYSKHTGRQRGWSRTKSCARAWRTPLPGARPLQPYTALPTMDPGARPHQPCKIHHEPRRTPTPAMHFLPPTPGPNDSGWLSTPAPGAVRIWRWPGHALAPDNTRPDAVQPAVGAGRHMGRKHLSPQHQTCTPQ